MRRRRQPARIERGSALRSGRAARALAKTVAVLRREVESVDLLQCLDLRPRLLREGRLPRERVEDDALQQIAQRQIQRSGQGLEDQEDALLHPYTRLHAGDGPAP